MNDLQKKYLRITRDGDISLSMWAHLAEHTDPGNIDKLWTSCGSPFLRTLGEKGNRAHRRLCALGIDERMTIWAKVKEMVRLIAMQCLRTCWEPRSLCSPTCALFRHVEGSPGCDAKQSKSSDSDGS